jgi:hypothetical protein
MAKTLQSDRETSTSKFLEWCMEEIVHKWSLMLLYCVSEDKLRINRLRGWN